ncbi:MAG: 6-carboxytetrahydropterin synthase [Euryarchaeota archaeon]|nr:6-carboxytetrahydropterin synthase [Euryarchaeota archaeon]
MMVKVDGWECGITFSAAHFIPGHDKCSRLHGHAYALHVKAHGDKGADGLLLDFVRLKEAMREAVKELDHKVLLPMKNDEVKIVKSGNGYSVSQGGKAYLFPAEDVVLLDITVPTAEELAEFLLEKVIDNIGGMKGLTRIEAGLDEGKGQGAWVERRL